MLEDKKISSVKKNYLYSVAFQILSVCLPLITSPYISRILGPEMIGTQSYCHSIADYFYIFIMLGVANYGNRSIARVRDDRNELARTFWTIYGFQLLRAFFVAGLYICFVFVFANEYMLISFLNGIYVLSGAIEINWFFFGLEKFKITVIRNAVIKILNTCLIFLLIKKQQDIWIYSILICGSAFLTNVSLWPFVGRNVSFYKPTLKEFIPHIKPELILFVPVIAVSLYTIMDKIMLGFICTTTDVGYYNNALSIIMVPFSFVNALGSVMMPHASNLAVKDEKEKSKREIEKSIIFVIMISIAMSFGLAAISDVFAPVYFGREFEPCARLIAWLSPWVIICSWANVIRTQYLIPRGYDKVYTLSIISGAAVNMILNSVLIPVMGARGAALGTLGAELTVALFQTIAVKKELPIGRYLTECMPFVICGLVMYIGVKYTTFVIGVNIKAVLAGILIGVVLYFALAVPYMFITKREAIISVRKSIFSLIKR